MKLIHNRYQIKSASQKDIVDLTNMLFALREHMSKNNSLLWEYSEKRAAEQPLFYQKMIANPNIHLLIVFDSISNSNIGMGFGWIIEDKQYKVNKYGQIGDIWIDPKHRCKSLCKNLVLEILEFFSLAGIESLSLDYVHGNHEAKQVWKKLGFQKTQITVCANLSDIKNRYA